MKNRLMTLIALLLSIVGNIEAQYEIYTNDGGMYFWEEQQLYVNENGPVSTWTLQTPKPILLSDIREVVRGFTVLTVSVNSQPVMYDHRLQLTVGETAEFTATVLPQKASIKDVTWTTSDPSVATVNNGHVEALSEGMTTISVRANQGGYTVKNYVMVKGSSTVHVTNLTLEPTEMTLYVGDEGFIKHTVTPQNATVKDVTWSSASPNIATVEDGVVKAIAVGTTTITAKTIDGGIGKQNFKYATCKVTVKERPTEVPEEPAFGIKLPGTQSFVKLSATAVGLIGQHFVIQAFADQALTRPLSGNYTVTLLGQQTLQYNVSNNSVNLWGRMAMPEPATIKFVSSDGKTTMEETTLFDLRPAVVVATTDGVCVNGVMVNNRNTVKLLSHPWYGVCELVNKNDGTSESYRNGEKAFTYPGRADAFCFDDYQNMITTVVEGTGTNQNCCVYAENKRVMILQRAVESPRMPSVWAQGYTLNQGVLNETDGLICTTTSWLGSIPGSTSRQWTAYGWDFNNQSEFAGWDTDVSYVQIGYYARLNSGTSVSAINYSTQQNSNSYDPQNSITNICFDGDAINILGNTRVWSDNSQVIYTYYNNNMGRWALGTINENLQERTLCTRVFDPVPQMFAQNYYGEWLTAGMQNGTFVVLDNSEQKYFSTTTLKGKTINDFILAHTLPDSWFELIY